MGHVMSGMLKKYRLLCLATFLLVFSLTVVAHATITGGIASCSATSGGSSVNCVNSVASDDSLALFTNRMEDYFNAPDAYHLYFTMTSWFPSVTRGAPVYQTYYIYDSFNASTIYTNNDYNQRFLNDFSLISIGTGVTAGYHPVGAHTL
jgi:hypothetical protein